MASTDVLHKYDMALEYSVASVLAASLPGVLVPSQADDVGPANVCDPELDGSFRDGCDNEDMSKITSEALDFLNGGQDLYKNLLPKMGPSLAQSPAILNWIRDSLESSTHVHNSGWNSGIVHDTVAEGFIENSSDKENFNELEEQTISTQHKRPFQTILNGKTNSMIDNNTLLEMSQSGTSFGLMVKDNDVSQDLTHSIDDIPKLISLMTKSQTNVEASSSLASSCSSWSPESRSDTIPDLSVFKDESGSAAVLYPELKASVHISPVKDKSNLKRNVRHSPYDQSLSPSGKTFKFESLDGTGDSLPPEDIKGWPAEEDGSRAAPHQLPPCKVCGVQATGFHYGVNTCEACKGFFRRSIIRKQDYICANNSVKCAVRPGKRNTCAACRYQKCLDAGMSVDSIKIGRYTYAKRTKDILELRKAHVTETVQECKHTKENEVQQYIDEIVTCHESRYPECLQTLTLVQQVQEQVKEQNGGNQSAPIPLDEFMKVFCTTGVELDDRLQILNHWVQGLEEGLRLVVNFAKDIPGFKELQLSDQMALLKHSICEVWVVSRHKAFHKDFNYFTTYSGFTFDVVKALGEDLGTLAIIVARQLHQFNLSVQETIILKAMCIFFADRCELADPEKVEAVQAKLIEAFLYLVEENHPNDRMRFPKIVGTLTMLRNVTECYHKYTERLRLAGAVSVPPLFLEIITLKK